MDDTEAYDSISRDARLEDAEAQDSSAPMVRLHNAGSDALTRTRARGAQIVESA